MNINFGSTGAVKFFIPKGQLEKAQKNSDHRQASNALLTKDLRDEIVTLQAKDILDQLKTAIAPSGTAILSLTSTIDTDDGQDILTLSTNIPNEQLAAETELIQRAASWLDDNVMPKNTSSLFTDNFNSKQLDNFTEKRLLGQTTNIHAFMPPEVNEAEV